MSQSLCRKENAEEPTPGVVSGIGEDATKSSSANKMLFNDANRT